MRQWIHDYYYRYASGTLTRYYVDTDDFPENPRENNDYYLCRMFVNGGSRRWDRLGDKDLDFDDVDALKKYLLCHAGVSDKKIVKAFKDGMIKGYRYTYDRLMRKWLLHLNQALVDVYDTQMDAVDDMIGYLSCSDVETLTKHKVYIRPLEYDGFHIRTADKRDARQNCGAIWTEKETMCQILGLDLKKATDEEMEKHFREEVEAELKDYNCYLNNEVYVVTEEVYDPAAGGLEDDNSWTEEISVAGFYGYGSEKEMVESMCGGEIAESIPEEACHLRQDFITRLFRDHLDRGAGKGEWILAKVCEPIVPDDAAFPCRVLVKARECCREADAVYRNRDTGSKWETPDAGNALENVFAWRAVLPGPSGEPALAF